MAAVPKTYAASALATAIRPTVKIGGADVPVFSFTAQLGAYGSVGRFSFETSSEALVKAGFAGAKSLAAQLEQSQAQPPASSPSLPIEIWSNGAYGQPSTRMFGGDVDMARWDFDRDRLMVEGRDYAGRLMDVRIVLNRAYQHMTPSLLAQKLASEVSLAAQIPASSGEHEIGYYLQTTGVGGTGSAGANPVKLANPRPAWDLLTFLARNLGYQVNVTPDQTLHFGPPAKYTGAGYPRVLTYRAPASTANVVPVRALRVDHSPRRNGTFQVLVMSYHPVSTQLISSRVLVLGQAISVTKQGKVPAGIYKGSGGEALRAQIGDKLNGKPVYLYYIHGLTAGQTEQIAEAIALDITKRAFIVHGEIDGDPTLAPQMPVQLAEGVAGALQGYAGRTLTVASVSHQFQMARGNARGGGYVTQFKAFYQPPAPQEAGAAILPPVA